MLLAQFLVAGQFQRQIKAARVIRAVVNHSGGSGVGKIRELWEILQADLGGILLEFRCHQIDRSLDQIRGFRAPRSAVGIRGHFIREHADDLHANCGDFVAAGGHQSGESRNQRREQLVVSTQIGDDMNAQAENRAVALESHFDVVNLVAAVNRGLEIFAA